MSFISNLKGWGRHSGKELPKAEISGVGTVLAANMAGMSWEQDSIPTEELARIFNEVAPILHETIERYSGQVVRIIGDAALAAWGQQPPSVNHAQLAFDAARSIQRCISSFASASGMSFDIQIALGTGDLRVGVVGMGTQAYGRAANLAHKLHDLMKGKRDVLFLSGETFAMLGEPASRFRWLETGPDEGLGDAKVFEYLPEVQTGAREMSA